MNAELTPQQVDECLLMLEHGLVLIRAAARDNDSRRVEQLSDALHNLPRLLLGQPGWTLEQFEQLFLTGELTAQLRRK